MKKTTLYAFVLFVASFMASCLGKTGADKSPSGTPERQANIALVKTFVNEVINQGKINRADDLWAPDLQWHLGEKTVYGIDNYKSMLKGSIGCAFKDMHLEILKIVADSRQVVLYFTNSGLNDGSFNGMSPTHKFAKWHGMGIYRIANGKIAEAWFTEDILEMYQQLGLFYPQNNKPKN